MAVTRSPEIEAVARRVVAAYQTGDMETMANLVSPEATLRVLGFDADEWWAGPDEFLKLRETQSVEIGKNHEEIHKVEAFEEGSFGWVTVFSTLVTPETETPLRHTAVLRLETGSWRVIQWHNSVPVPNQQIFGVALTTTLDDLVASVLDSEDQLASVASSEGTMTLVFTDIVDSTVLAESAGDVAWAEIIGAHESAIRGITASQGGTVVKFLGDGSMLAFESARAAVRAAVEIQRESAQNSYAIRVGIHTGEVIRTGDDLFGLTVNKAARITAAADPGGIMASSTTRDLVGSMEGIQIGEPKIVVLKGLSNTHQIIPIDWD
jgi:class 3 adenylate cyclase/ketosteroid isomerase-like protein